MTIVVFLGPDRTVPAEAGALETPPRDAITIETALQLRDDGVAERVVAISLDSGDAETRLRDAVAAGADEAAVLEAPRGAVTTVGLAHAVHEFATHSGAQIVVVRNRTSPLESCLLAPALGEVSGWPAFSGVVDVASSKPEQLLVRRKLADAIETWECSTPVVLGVERGPELRYPGWADRRRAMRSQPQRFTPEVWGASHPDANPSREPQVVGIGLPKPLRRPAPFTGSDTQRAVELVMGDTTASATSLSVIAGEPAEIAARLAPVLLRAAGRDIAPRPGKRQQ